MLRQIESGELLFDVELALPVVFIVLATAGLVLAASASYFYIRFERPTADKNVPAAISTFVIYYALLFAALHAPRDILLPTLLLFLMAVTLALVIWFGWRAHSKAGIRIALAGGFTLAAFTLVIGRLGFFK